jgi:hypothetical protein
VRGILYKQVRLNENQYQARPFQLSVSGGITYILHHWSRGSCQSSTGVFQIELSSLSLFFLYIRFLRNVMLPASLSINSVCNLHRTYASNEISLFRGLISKERASASSLCSTSTAPQDPLLPTPLPLQSAFAFPSTLSLTFVLLFES